MPAPLSPPRARAIRRRLLAWYAEAHRDFPWRRTRDPYAVLVSEVMLQQTQAGRVVERFDRFLDRFPTATALAAASEAEVLAEWSGLGYNRRALALRRTAATVTAAGWPTSVGALARLPGIGPYTARAVASLAFGQPVGVVDTNVRRWLVRRTGLVPGSAGAAPAALQQLADRLARPGRVRPAEDEAAAWTHASMEFGAAICRARAPRCHDCPIARGCPSRGRAVAVPVPRQPAFAGSRRAVRGAILRRLAATPGQAVAPDRVIPTHAHGAATVATIAAAIDSLVADGLAHRDDAGLRLGPAPPVSAGTIGR